MIFGDSVGEMTQKRKVDIFWRSPCHFISSPEVLLATPGLLHFIDLGAPEVG